MAQKVQKMQKAPQVTKILTIKNYLNKPLGILAGLSKNRIWHNVKCWFLTKNKIRYVSKGSSLLNTADKSWASLEFQKPRTDFCHDVFPGLKKKTAFPLGPRIASKCLPARVCLNLLCICNVYIQRKLWGVVSSKGYAFIRYFCY